MARLLCHAGPASANTAAEASGDTPIEGAERPTEFGEADAAAGQQPAVDAAVSAPSETAAGAVTAEPESAPDEHMQQCSIDADADSRSAAMEAATDDDAAEGDISAAASDLGRLSLRERTNLPEGQTSQPTQPYTQPPYDSQASSQDQEEQQGQVPSTQALSSPMAEQLQPDDAEAAATQSPAKPSRSSISSQAGSQDAVLDAYQPAASQAADAHSKKSDRRSRSSVQGGKPPRRSASAAGQQQVDKSSKARGSVGGSSDQENDAGKQAFPVHSGTV